MSNDRAVPIGSGSDAALEVLHNSGAMIAAELGQVCVVIWRGAVTKVPFKAQSQALARVVSRYPGTASFVCVIEPTAEPPSDELRRASVEMVSAHAKRLKCVACVIEGSGFRAAVTRGVLSGMILVLPRKVPVGIFANVWPAGRWITEYVSVGPIEAFTLSVEKIRSLLASGADPM